MVRLDERIRIGIVGLGWIGQEIARAAFEDPRVSLVGVADVDGTKAGRDLGEIIGEGRLGLPIDVDVESMLSRARPEVAIVCSTSEVEAVGSTLELCISHGAHVVTTCENLADPESAVAQLKPGIEERARSAGVVILATGVNPGFAMDRLPVMLSQVTRNIRRIRVVRVVDAATRRAQLQAKIGVGMTPQRFSEAIRAGEVGHAGLSSSLRLVAKGLGISLDKTTEAFAPVLADAATASVLGPVPSGRVRGIYQIARGYRSRREIITLELTMALDEPHPRDTIDIVGEPPIHFEGELPGDDCTVASVLSAVSVVVTMPPGLRTVLDVPLERPEEPRGTGSDDRPGVPVRGETLVPSKRVALREPWNDREVTTGTNAVNPIPAEARAKVVVSTADQEDEQAMEHRARRRTILAEKPIKSVERKPRGGDKVGPAAKSGGAEGGKASKKRGRANRRSSTRRRDRRGRGP